MDKNLVNKKRGIILIIFICIVAVAFYFVARPSKEEIITRFVENNETQLRDIANQQLNGDYSVASLEDVKVDGVFKNNNGDAIVQFFYSGEGIAPAGKYYGFYYSPSETPAAYQNVNAKLEDDNGTFRWRESGDNGGLTKKIGNGWYYYEAWF